MDKLKEYGIGTILFDPCGNTPAKGAAQILDMYPETLRSRIQKLGIKPSELFG